MQRLQPLRGNWIQANQATLASHIQRLLACMMAGNTAGHCAGVQLQDAAARGAVPSLNEHSMQATGELGGAGDLSLRCLIFGTRMPCASSSQPALHPS